MRRASGTPTPATRHQASNRSPKSRSITNRCGPSNAPVQHRLSGGCGHKPRTTSDMMNASLAVRPADGPSGRQISVRRRLRHLAVRRAVCCAANAFFCFKSRSVKAKALWSGTERVWLGRETFLHWALWDTGINIPWVVAEAMGAPAAPDELRAVVGAELAAYWERQLTALPRRGKPDWLPLP
jgi:hypothetical protein